MSGGRLFIEADCVLMDHADINHPEELIKEGYYAMRIPEWRMISAVRDLTREIPELEVYIVCHVPLSMESAKAELAEWFGRYLPDASALRFLPLEEYFGSYIALQKGDVLISADVRTLAVFAYGGGACIGVDTDRDAVPGIRCVSTWEHEKLIADQLRRIVEGR